MHALFVHWERFQIITCFWSSNPISLLMYMPQKILKHEYKPQGTDLCNLGKCWDGRKTFDMLVGMIFFFFFFFCIYSWFEKSSTLISHMDDIKMVCRCKDLLKNRKTFLTKYIQEKIMPTSMSNVLHPSQHFPVLYKFVLWGLYSCFTIFRGIYIIKKNRLIGFELHRKQVMIWNLSRWMNGTWILHNVSKRSGDVV